MDGIKTRQAPIPPWRKRNPRKKHTRLTPAQIEMARERAARAGRTYPNLIDNMWAARQLRD